MAVLASLCLLKYVLEALFEAVDIIIDQVLLVNFRLIY